jgi:pimeloyl-ACP methyl ester carboxylesterase
VTPHQLAHRSVGSGPPLLLINGYAATGADWDPSFLERLGGSFEVICSDNCGVGDSPLLDPSHLSVDSMAADLEALLDRLGLERAPVVGWSLGGFVAQRLTARSPERVAALALLSTDPGGPEAMLAEPAVWSRLTDHSGTPREQASRMISLLFPPDLASQIDEQFGDVVAAARANLSDEVLTAQERAMDDWHAHEPAPAPEPPRPALIAHGELDQVIPAANARALAAHWPGARIELFAGGGHAFMAQEPQRLAALIAGFVAGATAR